MTAIFVIPFDVLRSEAIIVSENFYGEKNWGFHSLEDPNSQIGGTGELVYSFADPHGKSYLTKNFNMTDFTTAQTGTLIVSGTIDTSNWVIANNDFTERTFLCIGAATPGNQNGFDGSAVLFNLKVSGLQVPGQSRFLQTTNIKYWGSSTRADLIASQRYAFTSIITVSGDNETGWTVSATTEIIPNTGTPKAMTSSYFMPPIYLATGGTYYGLQSINRLMVGFVPNATDSTSAGHVIIDDLSLSVTPDSLAPMNIGINLNEVNDYTPDHVFVDAFKKSRDFCTRNADGSGAYDTLQAGQMAHDANGWPTQVPFTPPGYPAQIAHSIITLSYPGTYTLKYDGVGTEWR